jgi:hypothetical protein
MKAVEIGRTYIINLSNQEFKLIKKRDKRIVASGFKAGSQTLYTLLEHIPGVHTVKYPYHNEGIFISLYIPEGYDFTIEKIKSVITKYIETEKRM